MDRKLTGKSAPYGLPPAVRAGIARPESSERTSVPKSEEFQPTMHLEPGRRRLIVERLHGGFYQESEPAERIAIAVYAALHEPGHGSPLPQ